MPAPHLHQQAQGAKWCCSSRTHPGQKAVRWAQQPGAGLDPSARCQLASRSSSELAELAGALSAGGAGRGWCWGEPGRGRAARHRAGGGPAHCPPPPSSGEMAWRVAYVQLGRAVAGIRTLSSENSITLRPGYSGCGGDGGWVGAQLLKGRQGQLLLWGAPAVPRGGTPHWVGGWGCLGLGAS